MYNTLKRLYFKLVFWKNRYFPVHNILRIEPVSKLDYDTFYGYYTEYPVFDDKIIYHSTKRSCRPLDLKNEVSIVFQNLLSGNVKVIGKSTCFNFQQGSRLRWEENFIFYNAKNKLTDENIVVRYDSVNDVSEQFKGHFCELISKSIFLSFDYDYLTSIGSEYGYIGNDSKDSFSDSMQNICLVDVDKGLSTELLNFVSLKHNFRELNLSNFHVNHILLNPSRNSFVGILRGYMRKKRLDILFKFCLISNTFMILQKGYISHYTWKDDRTLIYYGNNDKKRGYFSLDVKSNKATKLPINTKGDGHMSIFNDEMVFDTYPGYNGLHELWIYSFKNKTQKLLGVLPNNGNYYGRFRCDLHPRIGPQGIFLDSAYTDQRRLYKVLM